VRDLYDAVHYQEANVVRTLITYFDVSVDDEDVSDSSSGGNGCYRWNQFLSLLTAIQIGYETSYVTVMSLDSLTTELSGATNVTCNLASIAESISDALMSNYGASSSLFSAPCLSTVVDGRIFAVNSTWKVGRCGISPFLEVWVNSTQFMQLSPCNASCDKAGTAASPSSIGVIRGVGVQFRARHQAPTILSLVVIAVYKSTISVTAQLNDRGLVYCAAYDTASYMAPSSVGAIMMASVSTWSSGANGMNISYLNITGLAASTNHTVLCFASSVQSISTPLQTVLTMYNRTVTTSCCRQLSITLLTTAMVLSSSARSTSFRSNALMIAISSLPTTTLSVSVCLTKDNVAYNSAFSPSTLTFDSSASSVRPLALTLLANAGTYNLTVTLSGSSKHLYETVISGSVDQVIVLDALSTAISVPAPKMLSATFSSDGINISIVFDRSVNLGQELGTNVRFACSRLFRFGDSSAASISTCQFGANGTVVTVMPALSSILSIGSNVTLLGTTVKAACFVNYNCSGWEYAPSTTLLIGASVIQTVPTVSITAPNNIGACTNYVIDVSGSIGSGYRNWKSINYAVESTATNITDLQSYVSDLSTAPLLRMTIPYIYLNTQRLYSITVMMCNFLDVCGQAHVSLTVSSLSAPVVSVVGAAVISVRASQSLTLKAAAYTTSCGSTSSTAANLAYSWSLLSRSAIIGQIASANAPATTTSSLLSVGAYALTPLNTYEIVVSVTSLVTKQTSTASVTISVLQGDLVAVVGGGLSRSVRAVSWATMDGTNSYDSDQAAHGNIGIAFIWSMYQLSPTFQSYCYVRTVGNSATSLRVFGFTNATNSTCVISLAISLDTRTATASISVYFMSSDGPKVTISFSSPASLTHISVSSKISVFASVELESMPILCVWSFDDSTTTVPSSLSLSSIALTATRTAVPASSDFGSSTLLNLVIGPSLLPSSAQLTLALTCSFVNVSSEALKSVSTVQISSNTPPSPGAFTVSPTSGASLSTVFAFAASAWSDGDGDYPLKYEYGFVSPTDGTFVVIASRSLTVYATSTLPPGLKSDSCAVDAQLNVYDLVGAFTESQLTVRVNNTLFVSASSSSAMESINVSYIAAAAESGLAAAGLDIDSLQQVVTTISVAMNSVSCSLAPSNCSSLGRHDCSLVLNTCGECLPTKVGVTGASNDPCVDASEAAVVLPVTECESDADCPNSWYLCNSTAGFPTCYSPSKSCTNNCLQGVCVYEDQASGATRDICTQADLSCVAVCSCLNGYSGTSCDVSATELVTRQAIRSKLVDAFETVVLTQSSFEASTASAWARSLMSLSAASAELNSAAKEKCLELASYILGANIDEGFAFSTVSNAILETVDNVCSSTEAVSVKALVDELSGAGLADLVAGEVAAQYILSNYRMILQVYGPQSGGTHTIAIPLLPSEVADNMTTSIAMDFPLVQSGSTSLNATSSYAVSMLSLKSSIFSSYDPSAQSSNMSLSSYLANAVRMSIQTDSDICADSSSSDSDYAVVTFKFSNVVSVNTSDLREVTNVTYQTQCAIHAAESGGYLVSEHLYACPYGSNITHVCDGTRNYLLTSSCPSRHIVAQCEISFGKGQTTSCPVTEFNDDYTICSCSLCAMTNSTTSRRSLVTAAGSTNTDTHTAEVQALVAFLLDDYVAATSQYSTSFNEHSLAKAYIVVIAFGFLWSLMFLLAGGLELSGATAYFANPDKERHGKPPNRASRALQGARKIHIAEGRAASNTLITALSPTFSLLEAKQFMRAYVFTFFPNVYSEKTQLMIFWHEIMHKHRYMRIFLHEKGFRKFVGTLEIVTLLSAHMFLMAVFFDVEWPSDNGSCSSQTQFGKASCLEHRSMLDKSQSMCQWISSSGDDSRSGGQCLWVQPIFDPVSQMFITMMVIACSGPITVFVSIIIKVIALSPTKAESESRREVVLVHRASAEGALRNERKSTSPLAVTSTPSTDTVDSPRSVSSSSKSRVVPVNDMSFQSPNKDEDAASQLRNAVTPVLVTTPRKSVRLSFNSTISTHVSKVADVDESLVSYCTNDVVMRKQFSRMRSPRVYDLDKDHADAPAMVTDLLRTLRIENKLLTGREKMQFQDQWEDFLDSTKTDEAAPGRTHSRDCIIQLENEIRRVHGEAETIIANFNKLKCSDSSLESGTSSSAKDAMIGVQILELFVQDLLGPGSSQARLFANQRAAVQMKFATSTWVKAIAVCFLLVLDAYFVWTCILYGDMKGRRWQINWTISCFIYVLVDIFIKNVNIVFVIHYFIPELVKAQTDAMKYRLIKAIDAFVTEALVNKGQAVDDSAALAPFSVTDYLFVSTIAARAFPNLLESKIVLSYRSHTISKFQAANIRGTVSGEQLGCCSTQSIFANDGWGWTPFASICSFTFVNVLMTLGCQSLAIQKIVVQTLDPLIMGIIAFIGSMLIPSSLMGVPVVIGCILVVVCACAYYSHRYRKTLARINDGDAMYLEPTYQQHIDKKSAHEPDSRLPPARRKSLNRIEPGEEDSGNARPSYPAQEDIDEFEWDSEDDFEDDIDHERDHECEGAQIGLFFDIVDFDDRSEHEQDDADDSLLIGSTIEVPDDKETTTNQQATWEKNVLSTCSDAIGSTNVSVDPSQVSRRQPVPTVPNRPLSYELDMFFSDDEDEEN
jgi:hypothetical protein